jgi:hypothetical protein
MILYHGDDILDVDLTLTLSVLRLLDEKLDAIISQAIAFEQMDSLGHFDEVEHLLGFGVVGVQTYMTDIASFAGFQKHETFQYGPTTKNGTSKIKIINAVANYWKHRSEWALNGGGKRQEAIEELFDEVGYSTDTEYPVSGVLTELLTPLDTRLFNLAGMLVDWRNSIFSDPRAKNRRGEQDSGGNGG